MIAAGGRGGTMRTCAALAVGLLALGAPQARADTLVVLNKAEATASLIDLPSGRVVATLPTGEGPHEAAVSPDGRWALAANYGTGTAPGSTLTLIEVPAARVARTLDLGSYRRPHGVVWLDAGRALVTAEAQKALLVVDVEKGLVERAIATDQEVSHMVAVTPDRSRAFVANIGSGSVTVIDLAASKVLAQLPTGQGAEGIDITPDGRHVWVTNRAADTVTVLEVASLKTVAALESKSFPIRARVTPDGRHVLVSNARSGDLSVFDAHAFKLLRRVASRLEGTAEQRVLEFGRSSVPIGIVIPKDGRRAYVAHANADVVSILDLSRWQAVGVLKAGREPDGMAWSPLSVKGGSPTR